MSHALPIVRGDVAAPVTVSIDVTGRAGLVVGAGGTTIARIRSTSHASVSIMGGRGGPQSACVTGSPAQVNTAVMLIDQALGGRRFDSKDDVAGRPSRDVPCAHGWVAHMNGRTHNRADGQGKYKMDVCSKCGTARRRRSVRPELGR
jgi:hypothetical protein